MFSFKRKWVFFQSLGFVFILVLLYLFFKAIDISSLVSQPHPVKSFEESLRRIAVLQSKDPQGLEPASPSIFLHHGHRTSKAIVFFHGFTSTPRQFRTLGEEFYKQGYNVFIPRIPFHGFTETQSKELRKLTAEDLVLISDEAVDIAQGLGEKVIVAGLSMGGVMAGWLAQSRSDIDMTVLIAPNFGTYHVPEYFLKPSINFLLFSPNRFVWWDAQLKRNLKRPPGTYYGFYSRALGEIRRLGWFVLIKGRNLKPPAASILVITNANDQAVSKAGTDLIVRNWFKTAPEKLRLYEFPQKLKLDHDLIDPLQPNQNIQAVYPTLFYLINQDFSTSRKTPGDVSENCLTNKIKFDLNSLDTNGIRGPTDGERIVDYEFCIPTEKKYVDTIKAIDSELICYQGSRGRIGCLRDEYLCIGKTQNKFLKNVLCQLSTLTYIKRIERTWWE